MKTQSFNQNTVERNWVLVDMNGQTLGRVASQIAAILRGKNKATYTPHADVGDFVVVVNSDKLKLTGNKLQQKIYRHHSGFPGGLKEITAGKLIEKDSRRLVMSAVKGMLPKNALGRQLLSKLKVYTGEDHPHTAQQPQAVTFS